MIKWKYNILLLLFIVIITSMKAPTICVFYECNDSTFPNPFLRDHILLNSSGWGCVTVSLTPLPVRVRSESLFLRNHTILMFLNVFV